MDRDNSRTKIFVFFIGIVFVVGIYLVVRLNPHSLSPFIAGLASFLLAFFVYSKDKKNLINKTFALSSIALAIFNFNIFGLCLAPNEIFAIHWTRIFRLGFLLVPPTFVHFTLAITRNKNEIKSKILYISYLIALIFIILNWTGNFEDRFIKTEWTYMPRGGTVYTIFVINLVVFICYSLFELIQKYRRATSTLEQNQLQYVFVGAAVAVLIGATNLFLAYGVRVYPFGSLGYIAYTGIVAYAIVKYQLMDIRVVISKGFAYASLVGAISGIYVLTVGIFQGIFGTTVLAQSSFLVNAFAAMIIAATFQPLKNRIRSTVDKIFFKEKYDPQKILKEFTWSLSLLIEADKIANLLINTVAKTLHITKGSVFLVEKETGRFRINATEGLNQAIIDKIYFAKDEFLLRWLKEENKIFIREEFEFNLSRQEFPPNEEIVQTLNKLEVLEAYLSIPLKIKDELVGVFNLSNKMSQEMFTADDLEFLSTLANQAVIALENARLYEEMRELEKNLHRADKLSALGTLAANIAHEIKNPLVAIKTFTQLFPKKFNDPEFQEKYNQIVPQELERLENILHELLNFSRPSKEASQPVEIEKIIDEILLFMDSEILKSKVRVIKEYQENLPKIFTNPDQMKQVFLNLLLNAI
ncbi:MAG TPA: hypothetical protein DHV62_02280, partial [Elusimicrobia bacterium]|nr:hypothetical protein [Elusimicrobiota bacterium]